jgi:hypothetical protein
MRQQVQPHFFWNQIEGHLQDHHTKGLDWIARGKCTLEKKSSGVEKRNVNILHAFNFFLFSNPNCGDRSGGPRNKYKPSTVPDLINSRKFFADPTKITAGPKSDE